jgi:hypothetical protein
LVYVCPGLAVALALSAATIAENRLKYENADFETALKTKERVVKKSVKLKKGGL